MSIHINYCSKKKISSIEMPRSTKLPLEDQLIDAINNLGETKEVTIQSLDELRANENKTSQSLVLYDMQMRDLLHDIKKFKIRNSNRETAIEKINDAEYDSFWEGVRKLNWQTNKNAKPKIAKALIKTFLTENEEINKIHLKNIGKLTYDLLFTDSFRYGKKDLNISNTISHIIFHGKDYLLEALNPGSTNSIVCYSEKKINIYHSYYIRYH